MEKLLSYFKLISDENRLRILSLLHSEELCVCELCAITGLSQPKVSKHIAKLRDSEVIIARRKEQFIYYRLNMDKKFLIDVLKLIEDDITRYEVLEQDKAKIKETLLEIRG